MTAPWGKSRGGVHPLICHLIDTAAVAERLYPILLGPLVRRELERVFRSLGAEPVASCVAVWCGLHDLGKLTPVFQALSYPVAIERLGATARAALDHAWPAASNKPRLDLKHGDATAAHVLGMLEGWGANRRAAIDFARAFGDHHGFGQDSQTLRHARLKAGHLGGPRWSRARDEAVALVHRLWGVRDPGQLNWRALESSIPALIGMAGLTTISDWLASAEGHFPKRSCIEEADLPAYQAGARERAESLLAQMDWRPWEPAGGGAPLTYSTMFGEKPRELQRRVAELMADRERPGVLVIEAPTGEGKTRAALLAAAVLAGSLGMTGMYVAMPTRALGRRALLEVDRMLRRTGAPLSAVAVHGAAWGKRNAPLPRELAQDDPERNDEVTQAAVWFRRDRALAAPVGVGTIDQALKAVFRARWSPMRLANLSGKVLVLDEVHAYDTYTSSLLDRLLWWCGRLGIPVVLLSATLTVRRREELLTEWQAGALGQGLARVTELPEAGGWQLTWADSAGTQPRVPLASDLPTRSIALRRLTDAQTAEWVVEQVVESGTAMLVHSTCRRAGESYRRIQDELAHRGREIELIYLDGVLSDGKRAEREARLYEALGHGGAAPRHLIVVGTSVLENLDLDVDLMASDPCPIDLLIQRAGRLHRYAHVERPSALTRPTLGLLGMDSARGSDRRKMRFPQGVANVFGRAVLESSWEVLDAYDELALPDQVPDLVHRAYADDQPTTPARANQLAASDRDEFRAVVRCIPRCRDDEFERLAYRRGAPGPTRLSRGPAGQGKR